MIIEDKDIYIRQSWLGDALMCLERGRNAIIRPTWRSNTDATVLGTSVHSAIEQVLVGTHTPDNMHYVFDNALDFYSEEKPMAFTSMSSVDEMRRYGHAMCNSWGRDIYPSITLGGSVEHEFNQFIGNLGDYRLHFRGTMDYLIPNEGIWDWKTSRSKYNQWEKQRGSVQASVYAYAAFKSGLIQEENISFKFGVMTRTFKSEGQIVEVRRTPAHLKWVEEQTRNLVASALRLGTDNVWPQVDQHFLCSEQWCSYWSVCKGAHISDTDHKWKP